MNPVSMVFVRQLFLRVGGSGINDFGHFGVLVEPRRNLCCRLRLPTHTEAHCFHRLQNVESYGRCHDVPMHVLTQLNLLQQLWSTSYNCPTSANVVTIIKLS